MLMTGPLRLNRKYALERMRYACERFHFCTAASGAPASEPSPHLISMEDCGADFLIVDFREPSQKSMTAELMLATERSKAKLGRMS
jgi:hypothetical protein